MFKFSFLIALFLYPASAIGSAANSSEPGADLRGQATLRFLGVPIYEARLYTDGGAPLDWQNDFGLEINYMREFSGQSLVTATLREMKRMGASLPARSEFDRCFFDVGKGDRYLAVSSGPDSISFWRNDTHVCNLSHPEIKRGFMSIFLGENTRSKAFTRKLRGK